MPRSFAVKQSRSDGAKAGFRLPSASPALRLPAAKLQDHNQPGCAEPNLKTYDLATARPGRRPLPRRAGYAGGTAHPSSGAGHSGTEIGSISPVIKINWKARHVPAMAKTLPGKKPYKMAVIRGAPRPRARAARGSGELLPGPMRGDKEQDVEGERRAAAHDFRLSPQNPCRSSPDGRGPL